MLFYHLCFETYFKSEKNDMILWFIITKIKVIRGLILIGFIIRIKVFQIEFLNFLRRWTPPVRDGIQLMTHFEIVHKANSRFKNDINGGKNIRSETMTKGTMNSVHLNRMKLGQSSLSSDMLLF